MTPNELLLWLSCRMTGSWTQFRGAVSALDIDNDAGEDDDGGRLALHLKIKFNLERLGHVEFDASGCENGWRVVPPVLAISNSRDGATGILCGARSVPLLRQFKAATESLSFERIPQANCPDVIRIKAPEQNTLVQAASNLGLLVQTDTPIAVLSNLRPIGSVQGWTPCSLPAAGKDWDVRKFVVHKRAMKWLPSSIQDANAEGEDALYCFTRFQRPHYFLREGGITISLPGAIGKFHTLCRLKRRVLRYNRKEEKLSMAAIFRPPLLTERGLILCSGFPPSLSKAQGRPVLTYRDVPEEIAGLAAEVLRQDLI